MKKILAIAVIAIYNLCLLGGVGYVVFFRGANVWWVLLACMLLGSYHTDDDE